MRRRYTNNGDPRIHVPRRSPIPVEDAIGITNRLWYPIHPKIRGYEISDDGFVRSLKLGRKNYPYGCIIRPSNEGEYRLVDSNGNKVEYDIYQLLALQKSNPYSTPRSTQIVEVGGRNRQMFQTKNFYTDKGIEYRSTPRFTIRKDDTSEIPLNNPVQVKFSIESNSPVRKICPIYNIYGEDINYGRKEGY